MPCYGSIVNGWAKYDILGVFRRFVVVYQNLANSKCQSSTKQQKMSTGMYIEV